MTRPVPEYIKVRTFVYKLVMRSQENGGKLPSENELCTMFNVSRITVREALQELVRNKIIITRRGMGTFVHPEFFSHKLSSCCIGYLRFGGGRATNQLSGTFSDCIEMLGMDYELLFLSSEESEKQLMETARTLSGIVWDGYVPSLDNGLADRIAKAGIPLLLISSHEISSHDMILRDSVQEGNLVAACARENGHQNIFFISSFGDLPFEQYTKENFTYPAVYEALSGSKNIPQDHYGSFSQFKKRITTEKDFLKKYTMLYSRRCFVRGVMECLSEEKIRVPEDISYLVFEKTTPSLFGGRIPSYIDCSESLGKHILNWLERRVIRQDKSGVFFEKQVVTPVKGESVRKI